MKQTLKLLAFLLILSCNLPVQDSNPNTANRLSLPGIDNYADTLLMDTLLTSLSVGVYHKGEVFTKHYGELDRGKQNPATNETIFEIASVTKTLAGTLIAQAELDGKLSIEDDVRKYMDGDYDNLEFEGHPIRIKHLITHTSLLPRFLPESITALFSGNYDDLPFRIAEIQSKYDRNDFLKDIKAFTPDTIPGTRFSYSNADTELIAYILENIHKKSFDEILSDNLTRANNMPNTTINLSPQQKERLANGYGSDKKTTPHMSTKLWGASGSGKSTIPDLINYIKFQLDPNNKVAQQTHKILYDDEVIFGDPENKIAYFWIVTQDEDFGKCISHHGGAFGMQNWLFLYPEADLGLSVITNSGERWTAGKLLYVVDGILAEVKKK